MLKERYQQMNAHIHHGDRLIESTLDAATPQKSRTSLPRLAKTIPVLALLLALTIATPALAAGVPAINEMLYLIAPEAALHFRPVNLSCEDNGVTVELMAVHVYGSAAQMYISVQGDMIDETVDLFDSYGLDTPRDASAHCELEAYLPESNTAVFFIEYFHTDGKPIEGQKLTFSMHQLLTGKQEHNLDLTHLIPENITDSATYKPARFNGWSGRDASEPETFNPSGLVLKPAEKPIAIVDGVSLSGYGYVDGTLRIQIRYEDILHTDNHGFVYFMTPDGWLIPETNTLSFHDGEDQIEEFIFSRTIPADAMLKGDFFTCSPAIEGDWSITFPLVEYGS